MSVALVLTEEAGPGPLTFPGFPGVWNQGEPIEASVFVEEGVVDSIDELIENLPPQLEEIMVAKGSAPMPERPNHVPNAEQAQEAGEKALEEMTHDELDALGEEHDGYPKSANKPEKVAFLESALAPEVVEEIGADAASEGGEEG